MPFMFGRLATWITFQLKHLGVGEGLSPKENLYIHADVLVTYSNISIIIRNRLHYRALRTTELYEENALRITCVAGTIQGVIQIIRV